MQMGPSRIPVSPARGKPPSFISALPATPPNSSPNLGVRRVSSPATHDIRSAGSTPRAKVRRPSEAYEGISKPALMPLPITPSTSDEIDPMLGSHGRGSTLTRRSADRRRPSAEGDGFPTASSVRRTSDVIRGAASSSTRRPSPHIDTSLSASPTPASRSRQPSNREPLSAATEETNDSGSIRSGHPSASSSKAGTPQFEHEGFTSNGFLSSGSPSRLPVPNRAQMGGGSRSSSSGILMTRESSSGGRSDASTSSLSDGRIGERMSNGNSRSSRSRDSRQPTPSATGSPSKPGRSQVTSSIPVPPLPAQRLDYRSSSRPTSSTSSPYLLNGAGASPQSGIPILGPMLGPAMSRSYRPGSSRKNGGAPAGNMSGTDDERWSEFGRRDGSASGSTSLATSPISPSRQMAAESALSTSPSKPFPLGLHGQDGQPLVIPNRRSSIPSTSPVMLSAAAGFVDLNSPNLGGPAPTAAPPPVSPRYSSLPPLHMPNITPTLQASRPSTGVSDTSAPSSPVAKIRPNLAGLGISTDSSGIFSTFTSGQISPGQIPAKSPARPKTPSRQNSMKSGSSSQVPLGIHRSTTPQAGSIALNSPTGRSTALLDSAAETVSQRRQQPELRIDAPPLPSLRGPSRNELGRPRLQAPNGPSRSTSQNSVSSSNTLYATPPSTTTAMSPPTIHPVDRSMTSIPSIAAGSMYTRMGSNEIKDGPTPPIPARNPLRRRASTKDGQSLDRRGSVNPGEVQLPVKDVKTDSLKQTGDDIDYLPSALKEDHRDSIVSLYSQPSALPFSATSAISSGSEATIGRVSAPSPSQKRDLRIDVPARAGPNQSASEPPTTAEMIKVMGFAAELEAKVSDTRRVPMTGGLSHNRDHQQIPNILKTLPDTPEEQSASTSAASESGRLYDERYRYPKRMDSGVRHAASQGQLPSPSKSPSMPNFKNVNGITDQSSLSALNIHAQSPTARDRPPLTSRQSRPPMVHSRSQSNPVSPLVNVNESSTLLSPTSLTPTTRMSKRAHLIHEICSTERSYAQDLALIRDVYLNKLGPSSAHSTTSTLASKGSGWTSPGVDYSGGSRLSAYTTETSITGRTAYGSSLSNSSKQDLGSPNDHYPVPGNTSRPDYGRSSSMNSNAPSTAGVRPMSGIYSSSLESAQAIPAPRSRLNLAEVLSPSDVRTIFMNLEQLAAFADELAITFERALGDASGSETIVKEGQEDLTSDRLGEVFLNVIPQLTNLYTTYCARHAQANTRLLELMQDPKAAAYLQSCWVLVQPYTNAWDLGSMLIKPVQRVMKYPLLFGDLLHCTSPVHPDYFNLRKAFEAATSIAGEINEVKRRKDVVERISSKDNKKRPATAGSVSGSKEPKVFGMSAKFREKFGKSKDKGSIASMANGSTTTVNVIVAGSERQLYELVARLDTADQVVRKVGKEINMWPDKVRDTWQAQKNMMISWTSVVRLDGSDLGDERIDMYANMVDDLMDKPWQQLDEEVRETVMPMFSTLLRLGVNPKRLVQKRESRLSDYSKVQSARSKSDIRNLDKSVLQGADDFVALHTQLLEELPAYVEGYSKILELALAHFAIAQARFYNSVRERLREYLMLWTAQEEADYLRKTGREAEIEILDGKRIVKGWHECWKPFMQQMEALAINSPVSIRSGNTSRVTSVNSSNNSQLLRASSQHSRQTDGPPTGNRSRSTSFLSNRNLPSRPSSIVSEAPSTMRRPSEVTERAFSTRSSPQMSLFGTPTTGQRSAFRGPSADYRTLQPLPPNSLVPSTPPNYLQNSPRLGDDGNFLEWKDQVALYQCACVAEFKLGMEIWYAGLPFLQMDEGDVIDILNEVGRVDQLADLPIDVGVPDDGLLVGKAMDGKVGLILCSFLEPLR